MWELWSPNLHVWDSLLFGKAIRTLEIYLNVLWCPKAFSSWPVKTVRHKFLWTGYSGKFCLSMFLNTKPTEVLSVLWSICNLTSYLMVLCGLLKVLRKFLSCMQEGCCSVHVLTVWRVKKKTKQLNCASLSKSVRVAMATQNLGLLVLSKEMVELCARKSSCQQVLFCSDSGAEEEEPSSWNHHFQWMSPYGEGTSSGCQDVIRAVCNFAK